MRWKDWLIVEVWLKIRPSLKVLLVDLVHAALLLTCLFIFKQLFEVLSIGGWVGEGIELIHSVSTLIAYVVSAFWFILDLWRHH